MSSPLIPITRKHALTFACFLVLYEFLTYLANDMIMPGMISVVQSFNAPQSLVPTSLTIYILGGASLQLLLGPLSDSFGRRPVMLTGAVLFFVFTLLIASSQSMNQFLLGRFFQGMGLCFIGVIGYATIQEIFAEMDAIRLIAIMANAAILAPLLGPVLGAIVIHFTSWRVIFISIAAFALLALWGLHRYMPEPIGATRHDGNRIIPASMSFKSIFRNYKNLVLNPSFTLSAIAIGIGGITCVAWIALAPVIMISKGHLSVIEYGLWQIPVFGATILGNIALHYLTHNNELKTIIRLGVGLCLTGVLLTALLPFMFGQDFMFLMPGIFVYFFSLSIVSAPFNRYALFITPVAKGTASAILSLLGMLVNALGIEIAGMFYHYGDNLAFGVFNLITGLALVVVMVLTFKLEPSRNSL